MELKANCKINLGLRVMRRMSDGFHDIETVMVPVSGLADDLSVLPHFPDSVLKVTGAGWETAETGPGSDASTVAMDGDCLPEQNLCMRAVRLVQREYGIGQVRIKLHKNIPTGAGLGGGSSDAAFTLRALDAEFSLGLPDAELEKLAARLGSDVPFFIRNTPQLCTGRGEVMAPVEVDLSGMWIVIIKPDVSVSTAEAYAGVTPRESLPAGSFDDRPLPEILNRPVSEWRGVLVNDFEESIFARHPEIAAIKDMLYDEGALYASMSGSGSAVYAIFDRHPPLDVEIGGVVAVSSRKKD